jgi:hypothetical protein
MTTISRTSPNPPLGMYPQLLLYGQVGRAPSNNRTRTTIKIVPMEILLAILNSQFAG